MDRRQIALAMANNAGQSYVPFVRATPGDYAPLGGVSSFTRADATTCATYNDFTSFVQTVAANVLRDSHYVGNTRTVLLEPTSGNRSIWSEAINGHWSTGGTTPTITDNAIPVSTMGVSLAEEVDNDVGTIENIFHNIVLTGDGTKGIRWFWKKHDSQGPHGSDFRFRDTTASVNKCLVNIVGDVTGAPVITVTNGVLQQTIAHLGGVYELVFQSDAVTAANTHSFTWLIASLNAADTGSSYWAGGQLENTAYATSYLLTGLAAVTRAVDALSFVGAPITGTLFYHYYDLATAAWADAVAAYTASTAITPATGRAYQTMAVIQSNGTLTAAQCKAILGGTFAV